MDLFARELSPGTTHALQSILHCFPGAVVAAIALGLVKYIFDEIAGRLWKSVAYSSRVRNILILIWAGVVFGTQFPHGFAQRIGWDKRFPAPQASASPSPSPAAPAGQPSGGGSRTMYGIEVQ